MTGMVDFCLYYFARVSVSCSCLSCFSIQVPKSDCLVMTMYRTQSVMCGIEQIYYVAGN